MTESLCYTEQQELNIPVTEWTCSSSTWFVNL